MKKNKIIGIAVATIGVVLSVGVSLALYVSKDSPKQIGIGVFDAVVSQDGDINYVVDRVTAGAQNAAYSPDHLENTYSFRIGAEKGADSILPLQKYTVGDLEITIESANTTLISNLTATGSIAVPQGKWQDGNNDGKVDLTVAKAQNNTSITLSYANFTALSVYNAEDVNSIVSLSLALPNNMNEETVLALAEATYTVKATWVEPNDFVYAYVTGTQYGWAAAENDSRMVPNAAANSFEWMYTGYRDTTPGDSRGAKCIKANAEVNGGWEWSGGSDVVIETTKEYDFYWVGGNQVDLASVQSRNIA